MTLRRIKIPRRDFLKRSALALIAVRTRAVGPQSTEALPTRAAPFMARAFALTSVYGLPVANSDHDGLAIAPDSVHQVSAISGDWYQIEHGFVHRTAMQPIQPYARPLVQSHTDAPFWAELIAPSSLIRAWCDAKALLRGQLGYGAVVEVLGTLTDDYHVVWYETPQGWVEALHFARVDLAPHPFSGLYSLVVNRTRRTIRLIRDDETILHTAYYGATDLDRLVVLPKTPIGSLQIDRPGDAAGRPWLMQITVDGHGAPIRLSGAWDHNQFGEAGGDADLTIDPDSAKTLYTQINGSAVPCTISIVR